MAVSDLMQSFPSEALALGGLGLGLAFGALAEAANFCTLGAVSDWVMLRDGRRLGAVALAAAVAMVGAQGLDAAGLVALPRAMYLAPAINWLGAGAGGVLFGFGMVYASGCPSRVLVRAGSGDMRAGLTLLVMSLAALATLSGILGTARVMLDQASALDLRGNGFATQGLPELVSRLGLPGEGARWLVTTLLAGALAVLAVRLGIAASRRDILAGLGVGLIITAGWALTGLAADDMAARPLPPASLSFVKPVADAIDWLERSTALGLPGFGAASVFGVLAGAYLSARGRGHVRLAGFADGRDLARHMLGAAAMGIGGVMALGCSIGQGLTGLSTLAVQSLLAATAIVIGARAGLKRLEASL